MFDFFLFLPALCLVPVLFEFLDSTPLDLLIKLRRVIILHLKPSISPFDIDALVSETQQFLESAESLFSEWAIPMSSHSLYHQLFFLQRNGPAVSWWCAPGERKNGQLGAWVPQTNGRSILNSIGWKNAALTRIFQQNFVAEATRRFPRCQSVKVMFLFCFSPVALL